MIYDKVITIYPELTGADLDSLGIILMDDGTKEFIHTWNHPTLQRPTDEQLAEIN